MPCRQALKRTLPFPYTRISQKNGGKWQNRKLNTLKRFDLVARADEKANAFLLAAAPELLEALESLIDLAEYAKQNMEAELKIYPYGNIQQSDIDDAEDRIIFAQEIIEKANGGR